jgi:hypothetical protein
MSDSAGAVRRHLGSRKSVAGMARAVADVGLLAPADRRVGEPPSFETLEGMLALLGCTS